MAENLPTSFVPQKPSQQGRQERRSPDILSTIGIVLFVASLFLAAGMFGYRLYLINERDTKTETVLNLQKSIDQQSLRELSQMSKRISIGRTLLESRVAPSILFEYIKDRTIEKVRFGKFFMTEDEEVIRIDMSGEAENFNTLAFQARVLGEDSLIKDQIFSNIAIDEEGSVTFTLMGSVDPSLILAKSASNTEVPLVQENISETESAANPTLPEGESDSEENSDAEIGGVSEQEPESTPSL